MIGISIDGLTHLKLLQPIMIELHKAGAEYILYHRDVNKDSRRYDRPTVGRIKKSSEHIVKNAKKIRAFKDNSQLIKFLMADGIKKFIGIEVGICIKGKVPVMHRSGIKVYSVNYLTDSMWVKEYQGGPLKIQRTFYTTEHIRRSHFEFMGKKVDDVATKCLGSPLLDQIKNIAVGNDVVVLLPNVTENSVKKAFGSNAAFIKIISKIYDKSGQLIFKTRKKQWLPNEIQKYAKEIVYDGSQMYPSALSGVLKKAKTVVIFNSSGVYEAVYSGAYVVNIDISKAHWVWDKAFLKKYFSLDSDSLYNFPGAVGSISLSDALAGSFVLEGANEDARIDWVKRFISDIPENSSEAIVSEILKS